MNEFWEIFQWEKIDICLISFDSFLKKYELAKQSSDRPP